MRPNASEYKLEGRCNFAEWCDVLNALQLRRKEFSNRKLLFSGINLYSSLHSLSIHPISATLLRHNTDVALSQRNIFLYMFLVHVSIFCYQFLYQRINTLCKCKCNQHTTQPTLSKYRARFTLTFLRLRIKIICKKRWELKICTFSRYLSHESGSLILIYGTGSHLRAIVIYITWIL